MSHSEAVSVNNSVWAGAWAEIGPGWMSTSPLQRLLLTADGTLTDLLEALYQEKLRVVILKQDIAPVGKRQEFSPLYLSSAESVLTRTALIQGTFTRKAYVYAESCIVLNRLDVRVRRGLLETDTGLGRLWKNNRIETFKEVLDARVEIAGPLSRYFEVHTNDALLLRRCRVSCSGRPVALLTEHVRCAA